MIIALTSDTLPLATVDDYADNVILGQISRIDGVGQAFIGGAQKPAIRIQIDPDKVADLGLAIDGIRGIITSQTVNQPKGLINGDQKASTVYANDQIMDVGSWNNLVVGYHNGASVRIRDIGQAVQSVENNQVGASVYPGLANEDPTLKGGRAVLLIIFKQPGANVIQTVNRINAALPGLKADIPPSIEMHIVADRTQTIRASVRDVELTLLLTVFLVTGVIFLFLRDVRATLIPAVVIPISLLGTTAVMLAAGFSLDNLSLMAMSIAVGFVVDDAIVMEEVIWRRIEQGMKPFDAALAGAGEIAFTILTISISLIAVFTPLMFMGGVVGLLMREFGLTLSAAVVVSIGLSLSLTPMLAGHFLRRPKPAANAFIRALEGGFNWIESHYVRALDVVLRHTRVTLAVFIVTLLIATGLYVVVPTGFFPQQDTGFVQGAFVTAQDSSFDKTLQKSRDVASVVQQDPAIEGFGVFIGGGGVNQGNLFITLKPKDSGRTATADQVITRLRPKLAKLVGVQTFLQAAQDINIGGRAARAQYQYTLSDADLNELNTWAPRLTNALQSMPQLRDVSSDQQSQASAVMLTIDRDAAARFGIAPASIDSAIYDLIGQNEVAQYFTQTNSYHVILEGPPKLQETPAILSRIFLVSPLTGKEVPLSYLVKANPDATSSLTISHQGLFPAATISFNLAPGTALGQATQAVEQARAKLGAPATLTGSFQGTAQAFQQSLASEPILILAALLAVYIILGILYESYIHPLTILSTLPSAGLGALLAAAGGRSEPECDRHHRHHPFDRHREEERHHDRRRRAATRARSSTWRRATRWREASHQRLRPILMTTACAMLGGLPMAFAFGTGSEFRQPLGFAIVGGLVVSQALTLFTTPVIYLYLDRLRRKEEGEEGEGSPRAPELAPAE